MTLIPLFPLQLVAFPGENLALHIFEDRYKELLDDCERNNETFGIPTFINKKMRYGTEMRLVRIVKRYPDGSCDIICRGERVFELLDFKEKLHNRLYAGGEVRFLTERVEEYSGSVNTTLLNAFKKFYKALDVPFPNVPNEGFASYTLAHKAGLTLEQEYDLLQMKSETERSNFLVDHLSRMTTTLNAVNRTKELIALNGHFKHFDPLDFTEIEI